MYLASEISSWWTVGSGGPISRKALDHQYPYGGEDGIHKSPKELDCSGVRR